jgi:fatty acid desaturase
MAARLEAWSGSKSQDGAIAPPAAQSQTLPLEQRLARFHRRRRRSRAYAVVQGAVWLAGSGAVVFIALAGMFGLR